MVCDSTCFGLIFEEQHKSCMARHTKHTLYGKFTANVSMRGLLRLVPTKQHNSYTWHTIVTQSQLVFICTIVAALGV